MSIINSYHELFYETNIDFGNYLFEDELKELDKVSQLMFNQPEIFTGNPVEGEDPKMNKKNQKTVYKETNYEMIYFKEEFQPISEEKIRATEEPEIEYPSIVHKVVRNGIVTETPIRSNSDKKKFYEMYVELTLSMLNSLPEETFKKRKVNPIS